MNTEAPNDFREQAEARIVALLLGEASPFEEAAVQDLIKQDPGLSAYYEEMKKVLSLVQAASGKGGVTGPAGPQPRLTDARRAALLQVLGQPAVVAAPIIPLPLWRRRWFMPAAIAASLAGLVGLFLWFSGHGGRGIMPFTMAKAKAQRIRPVVERLSESDTESLVAPKHAPSPTVPSPRDRLETSPTLFEFRPSSKTELAGHPTASKIPAIESRARSNPADRISDRISSVSLGLRGFYDSAPEGKTAVPEYDGKPSEARSATAPPSAGAGVVDSKGGSPGQAGKTIQAGVELAKVEQNLDEPILRRMNEQPADPSTRILERGKRGQDKLAAGSGPAASAVNGVLAGREAERLGRFSAATATRRGAAVREVPAPQTAAQEEVVIRPAMSVEMMRRYGLPPRSAQPNTAVRLSGESSAPQSAGPAPAAAPALAAGERFKESVSPNPIRLSDGNIVSSGGIGAGGSSTGHATFGRFAIKDGNAPETQPTRARDGLADALVTANPPPASPEPRQGGQIVYDLSQSPKDSWADLSQAAANQLQFGDAVQLAGERKRDIEKPDLFSSPPPSAGAQPQAGYAVVETARLGVASKSGEALDPEWMGVLEKKTEEAAKKSESPLSVSQNSWAYAPPGVALTVTQGVSALDSFGVTEAEKYQPGKPDPDHVPILGDVPELGALFRSSKPDSDKLAAGNFRYAFVTTEKAAKLDAAPENRPAVALREDDRSAKTPKLPPPTPPPEVDTRENTVSTFSLNVSDVSFRLAAASVEKGAWPDPAGIRTEEFVNAFDYRDPLPPGGARVGFAWEQARYPFAHNRDLVRLAIRTAAAGREPGRPLNLVVVLDHSGSMERADRVAIVQEAMRVLSGQLQPADRISIILFARTAQLWVDGLAGNQSGELAERMRTLNPQGGTNLEEALDLAYATALRHFLASGNNRVILMTDGAANLGEVNAEILERKVTEHRKKGIALDCFGIGWEGLNDDLLEVLSRHGDGRYGFLNGVEAVKSDFARQLTGALEVAAMDVKAQVEFNPKRVTSFRQVGYARHQLTQEQFRDNTVDAAEIGAAEAGNALYVIQTNPQGEGPLGVVRVRFKVPATGEYLERSWELPFQARVPALDQAAPSMRLAATAAACADWLANSPYAAEVTPDALESLLNGVPEAFAPDPRPQTLVNLIRQARSLGAK